MAEKSGEITNTNETESNSGLAERTDDSVNTEKITSTAAPDEISSDPDEIREQIEDTRREMDETINAIQEKLTFAHISEQVTGQVTEQISGAVETFKTTVADATIGKAGKAMKNLSRQFKNSEVTKKLGNNPIPLALAGFAIGLAIFSATKKKKSTGIHRHQKNFDREQDDRTQSGTLGEKAGKLYESIGDSAGSTYESVSGAAAKTYQKIGNLGGQIRSQYKQQFGGNPLADGIIALAAGAAVGSLIPLSGYENKLMGEARNQLMSQAQEAVRGTLDQMEQAVGQAKESIVEEVKAQTSSQ